jgi:homospermidine synthase
MKFILWTVVWFGFISIGRVINLYWYGSQAALDAVHTREVQQGAAVLEVALWFICYFLIIRTEK